MNDYETGISLLQKALSLEPDFSDAHYNLAVAYSYENNFAAASYHCDRAIELGYVPELDFLQLLQSQKIGVGNEGGDGARK
jgi:tetratricopeptide (TPR) repeat protein